MDELGIVLKHLSSIQLLGIIFDIAGAFYLSRAFIFKKPADIKSDTYGSTNQRMLISFGMSGNLFVSFYIQGIEARIGFSLLSLGFILQAVGIIWAAYLLPFYLIVLVSITGVIISEILRRHLTKIKRVKELHDRDERQYDDRLKEADLVRINPLPRLNKIMNNNTAIIALVVLLIIVGGFLYFSNRGDDGAIGGNNGTATTTEENGNEDEDENGAATTTGTNGGASTGGTLLSSGAALSARTVLASRLNTAIGNVTVTDVEAATWPNGCLGLARMGEVCTQALVEGYRVTLSSGGQTYVYRTNSLGTSVRLEQ